MDQFLEVFENFKEYNRIAYYAFVRGYPIEMVSNREEVMNTPERKKACIVSLLCVRDRVVYDSPMMFGCIFFPQYKILIQELEGKKASDYGLSPLFFCRW